MNNTEKNVGEVKDLIPNYNIKSYTMLKNGVQTPLRGRARRSRKKGQALSRT